MDRNAQLAIAAEKLRECAALSHNWDGEGSCAPPAPCVAAAEELLANYPREAPVPYWVLPMDKDGGILLGWKLGAAHSDAEIRPNGVFWFHYGHGSVSRLAASLAEVASALHVVDPVWTQQEIDAAQANAERTSNILHWGDYRVNETVNHG